MSQFFIGTENYRLEDGNEDFELREESSRERASLFRSWTHRSSKVLRCKLGSVSF